MATGLQKENEAFAQDVEAPPYYTDRANMNQSDGLPSYTQAITASEELPPSYDSIYGKVKAAKQQSSGILSFLKAFLVIILSTLGFTVLIAIFMAVPVSMIVMGSLYLDKCPAERMIPIYLIVAGCFGSAKNLYSLVQRCRKTEEEREEDQKKVNPLESVVNCFLFAWFIAGCVYIYKTNDFQSTKPGAGDYCDFTLYWYAFWITTSVYIIMGSSCFCVCVVGCFAACFGDNSS